MQIKNYKKLFFLALFLNILSSTIINSTLKKTEIFSELHKRGISLSDNQIIVMAVVGTLVTMFTFLIILVISRFLLVLVFKVLYKGSQNKDFLNEIYFSSIGLKLMISTLAIVTLISGTQLGSILTNIITIGLYVLYIFMNRSNQEKSKKDIIVQLVIGCLLILFI
ncbi:hypothetical protein EXW57_27645 (plasmid) [Bacillus mycoides]|uniref:hypothetical protein n=1 Tax=Bacillus mycoides TaxID=1405 RepID=UPI001C0232C8|nr:hypothetical protein [Bacillus mycoides]QWI63516.1 hypothetical protein EXW57_27645 [Bacillus mycoides]